MSGFRFEVPGPPVAWQRAGSRGSRRYTPEKTKRYENKVRMCALTAGVKRLSGPLVLSVSLYVADNRRRDGDNYQKAIQDALNGVAYEDDSQIKEWHGSIALDRERPRAVVSIDSLIRVAE